MVMMMTIMGKIRFIDEYFIIIGLVFRPCCCCFCWTFSISVAVRVHMWNSFIFFPIQFHVLSRDSQSKTHLVLHTRTAQWNHMSIEHTLNQIARLKWLNVFELALLPFADVILVVFVVLPAVACCGYSTSVYCLHTQHRRFSKPACHHQFGCTLLWRQTAKIHKI